MKKFEILKSEQHLTSFERSPFEIKYTFPCIIQKLVKEVYERFGSINLQKKINLPSYAEYFIPFTIHWLDDCNIEYCKVKFDFQYKNSQNINKIFENILKFFRIL
jgi:hypothetical protein